MNLVALAVGLAFGLAIAGARLHEYDVIHRMLLLQEADVFLLMASAVGVAAPVLLLLRRRSWQTPFGGPLEVARGPVERRNVLGAMVFGTGWAVAGTCPGPAIAMVATGSLPGLFVMAGIVAGATLYGAVARIPRWRPLSVQESAALNLSC